MQLKKELTLLHVFCICTGAMLSGLFILPGLAYEKAGPSVLLSYLIAGLMALTGVLSQAELASAMPKAGGTYFYVTRSMGSAVGSVYGIITWFSLALKSAYELFFIASIAVIIVEIDPHVLAIAICLTFILINIVGIKEAGRVQVLLVMGLLAVLLFYILRGIPNVTITNFQNFTREGGGGLLATAGIVFISFGGLLKIASLSEEVKNAGKVLPQGMLLSLIVSMIFYLTVVFIAIGTLEGEKLQASYSPIAESAGEFLGSWGYIVFSIAGILAVISAANTGIMAASRYPLALTRDELLPQFLGLISGRFRTPHISIMVTGFIVITVLFLPWQVLVKAASTVLILTYIFTCLAVIILRESRLQNYQPQFHSPLYPWVQLLGIVGFLALIIEIGGEAIFTSISLIIGGLIFYWFFGRIKTTKEYALLHLIERITAKDITKHSLETELKEIIRERDELLKDRFDHLVEACHMLDIDGPITLEEFFTIAARTMSERLHISHRTLFTLFMDRERESSTAISPILAIPHIIIEGEKAFDLLIARCREGIFFSEDAQKVNTVFLLVGTRDERTFHLRSLAAVAQIVRDPHFDKQWMSARNIESLRDTILLGKRHRH